MLIAFSGLAGAGKTTAAKHLVDAHGFVRVRFADSLKAMLKTLILPEGETDRWVDGDYKEKVHPLLGCTPRHAMQTLGTEWGRKCIDYDLWVRLTVNRIVYNLTLECNVVVDDCRFDNEFEAIGSLGGEVIRIHRPIDGIAVGNHESEKGCKFHRSLANFGSPKDFQIALDDMLTGENKAMSQPDHRTHRPK